MKILFIPYGREKAPATRYRMMQYLSYLKERDIDFHIFSAISGFSTALMIKSPDFGPFVKFLYYIYVFLERLIRSCYIVSICRKFDIIFLQRTTFPLNLGILLKMVNKHIIFDIDDAIYLPDKQENDIVTRIKKYIKEREVINVLMVSKAVIVENEHIKNFISKYCKNIYKIPGPIDTERFFVQPKFKSNEVVIGWIGSPATTSYLHMLDNVFKIIKERYNFVKFRFIGLGRYSNPGIEFKRTGWDYKTEVRELQKFDIGVMPMPDNEWTRGKLGCKMLQYMAVGIPSVVSYTPTNAEIIKDGENGFLVKTESEWIDRLSLLIGDNTLREKVGKAGRCTVEELCSVRRNAPRLLGVFRSLGG